MKKLSEIDGSVQNSVSQQFLVSHLITDPVRHQAEPSKKMANWDRVMFQLWIGIVHFLLAI